MVSDLSPLYLSLKTAGLATFVAGIGGILCARGLQSLSGRLRIVLETLILVPMVLPPTVIGYVLLTLLGPQGPIGSLTLALWGDTLIFTWWAAVCSGAVVAFPVVYLSARGAFEQVDTNLLDAARVFGANRRRLLVDMLLPLARPGLLAGFLLAMARSLGEFGATLMVAGRIPEQTETIPLAIYFAVEAGELQTAWFWSAVAIALASLILVGTQGLNRRPRSS